MTVVVYGYAGLAGVSIDSQRLQAFYRLLSTIAWTAFAKSALAYRAWNLFSTSEASGLFSCGLQVNPSRLMRILDCSSEAAGRLVTLKRWHPAKE